MKRTGWMIVGLWLVALVVSYAWHHCVGARVLGHCLRVESLRGEVAVSLWREADDYPMNAPAFFIKPADPRCRLSDSAVRSRFGVGWMRGDWRYLGGARSFGLVFSWWLGLLGLLFGLWCLGVGRRAGQRWRRRGLTPKRA